jgi:hypothetical protein
MKTAIIRLARHDDVLSARDKLTWSHAQRALLVWPGKGRVLNSRLDLTLLQGHAQALGVQLALVTRERELAGYARQLGIPVFDNLRQANRPVWRKPRHAPQRPDLSQRRTRADLAAERSAWVADERTLTPWQRLAVFGVGLLAVVALLIFFTPGAQVTIQPAIQTQALTLDLTADLDATSPSLSGSLPARLLTVTVTGQQSAPSTGAVNQPERPAGGMVQLINLSDRALTVPAGTVLFSAGDPPVRFVTRQNVELDGQTGASASVTVQALASGKTGNLPAGSIQSVEGPLGFDLRVEQTERMSGGSERSSRGPSAADYAALEQQLRADLAADAQLLLEGQVGDFEWLLPGSLQVSRVLEQSQEPAVGQPGDRAALTMRVEVSGWVVSTQHIEAIAGAGFAANQPAATAPVSGSLQYQIAGPVTLDGRQARLEVRAERKLMPQWSAEGLKRRLTGARVSDVPRLLEQELGPGSGGQVQVFPAWWQRMPFLIFRIQVRGS